MPSQVWNGPRVRMAVHQRESEEDVDVRYDEESRRVEYQGPMIDTLQRIYQSTHGGEILMTGTAYTAVRMDLARFGDPYHCEVDGRKRSGPLDGLGQLFQMVPGAYAGRVDDFQMLEDLHTADVGHGGKSVLVRLWEEEQAFYEEQRAVVQKIGQAVAGMKRFTGTPAPDAEAHQLAVVVCDIAHNEKVLQYAKEHAVALLTTYLQYLRDGLRACKGYECDHDGSRYTCVFADAQNAVQFAVSVQAKLMDHHWDKEVLNLRWCRIERDAAGRTVFRGPRLAMGIALGYVDKEDRPAGPRYFGPVVDRAAALHAVAQPGEVLVPREIYDAIFWNLKAVHNPVLEELGLRSLPGQREGEFCYNVVPAGCKGRAFSRARDTDFLVYRWWQEHDFPRWAEAEKKRQVMQAKRLKAERLDKLAKLRRENGDPEHIAEIEHELYMSMMPKGTKNVEVQLEGYDEDAIYDLFYGSPLFEPIVTALGQVVEDLHRFNCRAQAEVDAVLSKAKSAGQQVGSVLEKQAKRLKTNADFLNERLMGLCTVLDEHLRCRGTCWDSKHLLVSANAGDVSPRQASAEVPPPGAIVPPNAALSPHASESPRMGVADARRAARRGSAALASAARRGSGLGDSAEGAPKAGSKGSLRAATSSGSIGAGGVDADDAAEAGDADDARPPVTPESEANSSPKASKLSKPAAQPKSGPGQPKPKPKPKAKAKPKPKPKAVEMDPEAQRGVKARSRWQRAAKAVLQHEIRREMDEASEAVHEELEHLLSFARETPETEDVPAEAPKAEEATEEAAPEEAMEEAPRKALNDIGSQVIARSKSAAKKMSKGKSLRKDTRGRHASSALGKKGSRAPARDSKREGRARDALGRVATGLAAALEGEDVEGQEVESEGEEEEEEDEEDEEDGATERSRGSVFGDRERPTTVDGEAQTDPTEDNTLELQSTIQQMCQTQWEINSKNRALKREVHRLEGLVPGHEHANYNLVLDFQDKFAKLNKNLRKIPKAMRTQFQRQMLRLLYSSRRQHCKLELFERDAMAAHDDYVPPAESPEDPQGEGGPPETEDVEKEDPQPPAPEAEPSAAADDTVKQMHRLVRVYHSLLVQYLQAMEKDTATDKPADRAFVAEWTRCVSDDPASDDANTVLRAVTKAALKGDDRDLAVNDRRSPEHLHQSVAGLLSLAFQEVRDWGRQLLSRGRQVEQELMAKLARASDKSPEEIQAQLEAAKARALAREAERKEGARSRKLFPSRQLSRMEEYMAKQKSKWEQRRAQDAEAQRKKAEALYLKAGAPLDPGKLPSGLGSPLNPPVQTLDGVPFSPVPLGLGWHLTFPVSGFGDESGSPLSRRSTRSARSARSARSDRSSPSPRGDRGQGTTDDDGQSESDAQSPGRRRSTKKRDSCWGPGGRGDTDPDTSDAGAGGGPPAGGGAAAGGAGAPPGARGGGPGAAEEPGKGDAPGGAGAGGGGVEEGGAAGERAADAVASGGEAMQPELQPRRRHRKRPAQRALDASDLAGLEGLEASAYRGLTQAESRMVFSVLWKAQQLEPLIDDWYQDEELGHDPPPSPLRPRSAFPTRVRPPRASPRGLAPELGLSGSVVEMGASRQQTAQEWSHRRVSEIRATRRRPASAEPPRPDPPDAAPAPPPPASPSPSRAPPPADDPPLDRSVSLSPSQASVHSPVAATVWAAAAAAFEAAALDGGAALRPGSSPPERRPPPGAGRWLPRPASSPPKHSSRMLSASQRHVDRVQSAGSSRGGAPPPHMTATYLPAASSSSSSALSAPDDFFPAPGDLAQLVAWHREQQRQEARAAVPEPIRIVFEEAEHDDERRRERRQRRREERRQKKQQRRLVRRLGSMMSRATDEALAAPPGAAASQDEASSSAAPFDASTPPAPVQKVTIGPRATPATYASEPAGPDGDGPAVPSADTGHMESEVEDAPPESGSSSSSSGSSGSGSSSTSHSTDSSSDLVTEDRARAGSDGEFADMLCLFVRRSRNRRRSMTRSQPPQPGPAEYGPQVVVGGKRTTESVAFRVEDEVLGRVRGIRGQSLTPQATEGVADKRAPLMVGGTCVAADGAVRRTLMRPPSASQTGKPQVAIAKRKPMRYDGAASSPISAGKPAPKSQALLRPATAEAHLTAHAVARLPRSLPASLSQTRRHSLRAETETTATLTESSPASRQRGRGPEDKLPRLRSSPSMRGGASLGDSLATQDSHQSLFEFGMNRTYVGRDGRHYTSVATRGSEGYFVDPPPAATAPPKRASVEFGKGATAVLRPPSPEHPPGDVPREASMAKAELTEQVARTLHWQQEVIVKQLVHEMELMGTSSGEGEGSGSGGSPSRRRPRSSPPSAVASGSAGARGPGGPSDRRLFPALGRPAEDGASSGDERGQSDPEDRPKSRPGAAKRAAYSVPYRLKSADLRLPGPRPKSRTRQTP